MTTLFAMVVPLVGCNATPICPLEGTWAVSSLGCSGGSGGLPGPIDATYTFTETGGHTTWRLQGCTVEAHFEVEATGAEVRVRERRHVCRTEDGAGGTAAIPCCESGAVDVALTYTCRKGGRGVMDWFTALAEDGPERSTTGPWAGRGPWRGCRPGEVGMMRLERQAPGP